MSTTADSLTLVLDTSQLVEIGYGYQWRSAVRRVVAGALADTELWLSVYGSDFYNGHFQCCAPEQGVEVTLKRIAARPAALSGFVAADGTIWEIVSVKR